MSRYFDALETRDPAAREAAYLAALPQQIAYAKAKAARYSAQLASVDPEAIRTRAALGSVPVTHKRDVISLQIDEPPFGGLAGVDIDSMARVFQSPGPIYEPQGREIDFWRFARAFYAAGFRSGDVVHNSFSYHLAPGGWMADAGARRVGCTVFPAGVGNTEQQVQAIEQLRPTGYVGTPSFLRILLDKAHSGGKAAGSMRRALVSGEACPPSLRAWFGEHGVDAYQCYATAELGLIAYETEAREGLVVDEGVLLEIVDPYTGQPVPEGEVGEVVVTLFNAIYPLVRFATGDLSAILPGISPCGRTNTRIKGWLGRADQSAKVRGIFVHPLQVAQIAARHPELTSLRLELTQADHLDELTLLCESASGSEELAGAIEVSIRDICKLRGQVRWVDPGSLPQDGKVIDDKRQST